MIEEKCIQCRNKTALIQMVGTFILALLKLVVGYVGNSKALMADALHSGANIFTAFAIIVSKKYSDKPADEEHPFGHGKIEFVAAAVVSGLLVLGTTLVIIFSIKKIIYAHPHETPHFFVIVVAVISILTNEVLFRYLQCVGKVFNSASAKANSWAIRSDSFSSMAVIIGVIGSKLGFIHLDGIIGLVIGIIIVWVCGKSLIDSVSNLMDKSVPEKMLKKIKLAVLESGTIHITNLKARYNGPKIRADIEIKIDKNFTIEKFNEVASVIKNRVKKAEDTIGEVMISYTF